MFETGQVNEVFRLEGFAASASCITMNADFIQLALARNEARRYQAEILCLLGFFQNVVGCSLMLKSNFSLKGLVGPICEAHCGSRATSVSSCAAR